jgi:twitching motility protein PilI
MEPTPQQVLETMQRSYERDAMNIPAPEQHVVRWVGTHLGIAGIEVLIGEGEIEEIIETPATTPIPGTRPWVLGLAAHRGSLLPIVNGDVLFDKNAYSGRLRDYTMVIRRPGIHFGITLSHVFRDIKLPIDQRSMDITVDEAIAEYTLGGFYLDGKPLAVLDLDTLIAQSELNDASLPRSESNEESSNG